MQTLKDEVRKAILNAALTEFRRQGYQQASMRQIAQAAGITTGNIYRYYSNKEELFEAIVGPVYKMYKAYTTEYSQTMESSITADELSKRQYFVMVEKTIVGLFKTYSTELMILLNLSAGSQYENVRQELFTFTEAILIKVWATVREVSKEPLTEHDRTLAAMLAGTLVEGLSFIIRSHEEAAAIELLIDQLLDVYSTGITELLRKIKEGRNNDDA